MNNRRFFPYALLILILLSSFFWSSPAMSASARNSSDAQQPGPSQFSNRARPEPMVPSFNLHSDDSITSPVVNPAGISMPDQLSQPSGTDSGQTSSSDPNVAAYLDQVMQTSGGSSGTDAQTCYTYVQNGGFENNAYWYASPVSNVSYITQYYSQGARSMYMTTKNYQNPYLYQAVQYPSQGSSIFVRFKSVAFLDPGDNAYVSIWNTNWTQRLWYGAIPATQNGWTEFSWWLPQNVVNAVLGQTVNYTFEMYQDGDNYYSDLYLDEVDLGVCDTPAVIDPTAGTRTIDLNISLYRASVTAADLAAYQSIIQYASDAIYEMSNGKHFLGNVTFYLNGSNYSRAVTHVIWGQSGHPQSTINGYYASNKGGHLWMYDIFQNNYLDPAYQQMGGYTLAHELGHYFYGLYDEYKGSATGQPPVCQTYIGMPQCNDVPVQYSVMDSQYNALPNYLNDLRWLNFSIPEYNYASTNAQFRVYGASAWDTLVSSQDAPSSLAIPITPRRYYSELASVAPKTGYFPTIELSSAGAQTQARSRLVFSWIGPQSGLALSAALPYLAQVYQVSGSTVDYPQPAILVATITNGDLIARAGLQAQVTAPDNSTSALVLKDDGVAPDEFADDGLYSGIMPYNQDGDYLVSVTFNNDASQAVFTTIGMADSPWAVGSLVGENFSENATTTLTVQNFASDDHSDQIQGATPIVTDNLPHAARIDRAGDHDVFIGTLVGSGKFVLRLANFASGMQPHIRFLDADGVTLLGDFTFVPEPGYYYIFYVTGNAGASIYIDISQKDPLANTGSYQISFGRPLQGELYYYAFLPTLNR